MPEHAPCAAIISRHAAAGEDTRLRRICHAAQREFSPFRFAQRAAARRVPLRCRCATDFATLRLRLCRLGAVAMFAVTMLQICVRHARSRASGKARALMFSTCL